MVKSRFMQIISEQVFIVSLCRLFSLHLTFILQRSYTTGCEIIKMEIENDSLILFIFILVQFQFDSPLY